jgi:uncharacterized protein YcfL
MKHIALLAVVLTGCGSSPSNNYSNNPYPNQQLIIDKQVSAMSRQEVINAIHDCQENNLRAVMVTGKKNTNGHIADVIIDVTCAPKYKF